MKKTFLLTLLLAILSTTVAFAQKIDRQKVVQRNNPKVTLADPLNSLSVGNGHFATTVDVTGLQSYPLDYEQGVPLCAMSDWGWHSFPNVDDFKPEETQKSMDLGHGHKEVYAVEYKKEGRNMQATEYFRVNPHRLNLGNVALVIKDGEKRVALNELKDINQQLDLYSGAITSKFTALGNSFSVTTACEPCNDALISSISSKLLSKGKASVCITLPYPTSKHADAASDWKSIDKHSSYIISQSGKCAVIEHKIDSTTYYVLVSWEGGASLKQTAPHTYSLRAKGNVLSFRVEYLQKKPSLVAFNFAKDIQSVSSFWKNWWNDGAIVDFGDCTDTRASELERRVVLSQYLTYINCANSIPPQETGLTYNSWFGRPHLEMTWWHGVDFSLWDRPEVLENILGWYNDKAYPEAKKIAERQGFSGIRWMKMTDPWVGESPSNVGSFLTWQQPHYIYMAEEMWRRAGDMSSDANGETSMTPGQKEVLNRYCKQVEETAEFLFEFAKSCGQQNGLIHLYGQTAMQESMSKDFCYGQPFEQAYFVYGLMTAQKWRERMGKGRNNEWDQIIRRMAPLPESNGIYIAGIPSQPFIVSDSAKAHSRHVFDPFNYGGETGKKQLTEEDFNLKCRSDHPAVLGACGLLPDYGLYDRAEMQRTLNWVMQNWNWATTWGWDYGMTAMCAARLGDGENAINALLIDKGKNTYLVSGHNYQEPKRLRLYLPGNGALLDAVAMMCAGWDGCPAIPNPGFPQDGKWNVRWEGLHRMQ